MLDLQSFVDRNSDIIVQVNKEVPLEHIGSLTAQANTPIIFNNIKGFEGHRIIDQLFVNREAQSRVLNCEPKEVVPRLAEVIRQGAKPLKTVESGRCQEQLFTGDDVDLSMLPIVTHTDKDPYPYSTSFVFHQDPETRKFNHMFPRCGVLSRNEMVSSFVTKTANVILGKHRAAGTKMPQALVIGAHPAWELAGCYSHPHRDWWEAELFETITGHPGEVTPCKTIDLMVPADASIVIEGYVNPERFAQDGPSPGPTMLFTPYASQMPVFEVTAITMRNDPIYRNHLMTPFTDHQEMPRLFHEAIIFERLEALGIPVLDVHFPQGGGSLSCIIQVAPVMDGQVTDALLSVLSAPFLNMKMAIAVDPDINIYDYRDVHYAMATRVDPSRHVITVDNARGLPFDPTAVPIPGAMPDTENTRFPSVVGKWGIDATKPVPYRPERKNYERAWPLHWGEVRLADYLD